MMGYAVYSCVVFIPVQAKSKIRVHRIICNAFQSLWGIAPLKSGASNTQANTLSLINHAKIWSHTFYDILGLILWFMVLVPPASASPSESSHYAARRWLDTSRRTSSWLSSTWAPPGPRSTPSLASYGFVYDGWELKAHLLGLYRYIHNNVCIYIPPGRECRPKVYHVTNSLGLI